MHNLILFNKPYYVLSQFSDSENKITLKHHLQGKSVKGFYPAGRLDYDSEGLLALTNDGALQHRISHPSMKLEKTYWVQVEGEPSAEVLDTLKHGVKLNDGLTRPATVKRLSSNDTEQLWPRHPPIRARLHIPTQWLSLTISEGRNRQVRRMTAAVGHPTLRLIRVQIGPWRLDNLQPGEFRLETVNLPSPHKTSRRSRSS